MNIEYCDKCGYRLTEDDFHDGKGVHVEGKIYCHKCAPSVAKKGSRITITPVQGSPKGSGRIPGVNASPPHITPSGRHKLRTSDAPPPTSNTTIALLCVGLAVIGACVYILTQRSPRDPYMGPIRETSTPPVKPPEPKKDPKLEPRPIAASSMLLQGPSDEEQLAQKEFDAIEKVTDPTQKLEKIKTFIAHFPDATVASRARVLKERLEKGENPAAPPKALAIELVGWWRFDEGKGSVAADSSPLKHNGIVVQNPEWVVINGKPALHFKNDGEYVDLPNTPVLKTLQENDYSVAAWLLPDSDPAEEADHNHCGYSIIAKAGNHAGLCYYHGGYFTMDHWLSNGSRVFACAKGQFEPRKPYHVVGVVSVSQGETRIYIDGKLSNRSTWEPNKATRPYGDMTWKIGCAAPGAAEWAWPAKGTIREVRLYKGALSDADVEALAKAAQ